MRDMVRSFTRKDWLSLIGLALFVLWLSSCKVVKHTTVKTATRTDTTVVVKTDTLYRDHTATITQYVHDTEIVVKGAEIAHSYSAADLLPVYTATGKAVARSYRKDTAGMHIAVTVRADGGVDICAWCDSSRLLVANVTERTSTRADSTAHAATTATDHKSYEAVTWYDRKIVKRVPIWAIALCGFIIIAEIVWRLLKLYKKYHTP